MNNFVKEVDNLELEDSTFTDDSSESEQKQPKSPTKVVENLQHESEDDVHTEKWKSQKKHIFVLSEAGKPIYSR